MLFHAGLGFPGGFVGVDVFFVISGYLITSIIYAQQAEQRFQLTDFWARRIRRILPAATVMTMATLLIGYCALLPADYASLATSALWQQAMAANIYFWRNTGYFSGPADMMPLLHTWSLAVEEQFYLVYPFALVALARCPAPWRIVCLMLVAGLSFIVGEWAVHRHLSAAFYLLPTRAWELLIGGLLCSLPKFASLCRPAYSQALSLAGIAGIVLSATAYTAASPFPGARALLPCGGAALVIYGGSLGSPLVNRVLSWQPLVYVGTLSYSLYLWHWPLLVFLRHFFGPRPSTLLALATIAVTVGISYLSWRFVETPFRAVRTLHKGVSSLHATSALAGASLAISGVILLNDGFPHRAPDKALSLHAASHQKSHQNSVGVERLRHGDLPTFGAPDGRDECLIWGDSHAMSLIAGLDDACKRAAVRGLQATYFGTAPVLGFHITSGLGLRERAVEHAHAVLEVAKKQGVKLVILAAFWGRYEHNRALEERLNATIEELLAAGMEVAVVLDYATQHEDVPLMLARLAFRGGQTDKCGVSMHEYQRRNEAVNAMIRRIAEGRATVLDPAPFLTDEAGVWRAEIDGIALYYDDDHLSTQGSLRLSPMFSKLFDPAHATETSRGL